MASRFYSVQALDSRRGWVTLPNCASKKHKEAVGWAEQFATTYGTRTRVIRMPHGWNPNDPTEMSIPPIESPTEEAASDPKEAPTEDDLKRRRRFEKKRNRTPRSPTVWEAITDPGF